MDIVADAILAQVDANVRNLCRAVFSWFKDEPAREDAGLLAALAGSGASVAHERLKHCLDHAASTAALRAGACTLTWYMLATLSDIPKLLGKAFGESEA
eukprot:6581959-Alexandrium_andersonii.AAC.1